MTPPWSTPALTSRWCVQLRGWRPGFDKFSQTKYLTNRKSDKQKNRETEKDTSDQVSFKPSSPGLPSPPRHLASPRPSSQHLAIFSSETKDIFGTDERILCLRSCHHVPLVKTTPRQGILCLFQPSRTSVLFQLFRAPIIYSKEG